MSILSYLIWNVDPEFFTIPIIDRPVRWYGLLFALGFLVSQQIMFYLYRKEGKPEKDVETLTIYMIIATVIGARLGHVLFYEPDKYLANPIDILKVWEGGLASHGAAFGILFALWLYTKYDIKIKFFWIIKGLIGIPTSISAKKVTRPGQSYLQVVDRIVIVVALTGCLIRMGNFMNSEIYGLPTKSNFGVLFAKNVEQVFISDSSPIEELSITKKADEPLSEEGYAPVTVHLEFKDQPEILNEESLKRYIDGRFTEIVTNYSYVNEHITLGDEDTIEYQLNQNPDGTFSADVAALGIVRHPTQFYESFTTLMLCFLLFFIWTRYKAKTPAGLLLGLFLIILFGLRFVHELFKENQVAFEDGMALNMGQILSIPLILAGIFILVRALKNGPETIE
ncbi:prolipoprotein diacylglyceryl transferase [Fulvivirga lutea]|uniref:Phosphatidylglycerol--prolipoprotein diacylglyceryl transferase n=1 Tax=Fulvivirga lutea TaxID=2810512 RepID=A0A974WKB1_9BACT|nr:prolipoprotein diacylglyceryl transferase [Fulvivirga lutea]QSE96948.1 prolipoprotein diacylglyceryl transferase [Fulvivirga lutea]